MNELEKVSHEIMRFMRGRYCLDEVGDGKNELKFRRSGKTVLTIYSYEDRFEFMIIFGKAEREKFELIRSDFSTDVCEHYEKARTYHDGKWVRFPVNSLEMLEEMKKLIMLKKKPNRKPFPKEYALYGKCGQRCDICIHFTGLSEEFRKEIEPHLIKVWNSEDWSMRCSGCGTENCYSKNASCEPLKCAAGKGLDICTECKDYPCEQATVGDSISVIHSKNILADDVTWAILPYVPFQYGN